MIGLQLDGYPRVAPQRELRERCTFDKRRIELRCVIRMENCEGALLLSYAETPNSYLRICPHPATTLVPSAEGRP